MSLNCAKDWNYVAVRDWWFALFIDPPIVESPIRVDEEPLLWWGGFGKCVEDVCAIH